ncbi:hypothetical protein BDB00DRAFT_785880 [Zychaea mexicana]|uniref:uncharacterized protein n=1 Tax=Zychaea mexicana TaxID=64656 RepID=UPI0022FF3F4A|nr:uncharacterized protein BDB00DRAFT_785880 [Zychaea mexicana]KAI9495922.1 hypothetical protein BDB00DRAFT_785880 [Zychaea mexicana]
MDYDDIERYYIGRIVGSVVGAVVGLAILIIIAVCVRRRQKKELQQQQQQQQQQQIYYQPYLPGQLPPPPPADATQQMVAIPIPPGSAQLPQQPPQPGYYYAVLQPAQQAMPAAPEVAPSSNTSAPYHFAADPSLSPPTPPLATTAVAGSDSPGSTKEQYYLYIRKTTWRSVDIFSTFGVRRNCTQYACTMSVCLSSCIHRHIFINHALMS